MERHSWHRALSSSRGRATPGSDSCSCSFCIGLVFDPGHILSVLLDINWPMRSRGVQNRGPARSGRTRLWIGWRRGRYRLKKLTSPPPNLPSGQVTIAQISDLHLGMMLGDEFLDSVIAKLKEIKPDIVVATGTSSMAKATTLMRSPRVSMHTRRRSALTPSSAITKTMRGWITRCASCATRGSLCCAANRP